MGRLLPFEGLAESVSGPAFATCAGLLRYAMLNSAGAPDKTFRPVEESTSRFGRIGQWMRENF
jgi:cell division protein FtsA